MKLTQLAQQKTAAKALLSLVVAGTCACGSNTEATVECGAGTVLEGSMCVPIAPLEAGDDSEIDGPEDQAERDQSSVDAAQPNPPCLQFGMCPDMPMVAVAWPAKKGGFYDMDAYETWLNDYLAFMNVVNANKYSPKYENPACAGNKVEIGGEFCPLAIDIATTTREERAAFSVNCVDWCDATAYCEWTGKRLCTAEDPPAAGVHPDPAESEWYNACSNRGSDPGPALQPGEAWCGNGADSTPCEDGYPGIYSIKGRHFEWTAKCHAQNGGVPDQCYVAGSGDKDLPLCERAVLNPVTLALATIRCCK